MIRTEKSSEQPLITLDDVAVHFSEKNTRDDYQSMLFNYILGKQIGTTTFSALSNISLKSFHGDIIGVLGLNGAGKTTLCRAISKLIYPSEGTLKVEGEVSALLSLGTGFNPELSGNENIFLNGMMLGISKKTIQSKMQDIVEFADIGRFINEPVKTYSKGMKARLGFSIAANLQPEILILDEALSTGDYEFTIKAAKRIETIVQSASVVIVVTHDVEFVVNHCNYAIWLDKGRIRLSGNPQNVSNEFLKIIMSEKKKKDKRIVQYDQTNTTNTNSIAISVKNLGVSYKLSDRTFWAIEDVSFDVNQGEIIGIIGKNGAGKSTLCKVLSNIIKSDRGTVYVSGDVVSLLGFGSGFNHQLSGRDNVLLNGLFLGIPKKRIMEAFDEIIEFSELGDAIDKPVKYYSSGMRSRLGFSIAACIEPEILIIDEALSAGDIVFNEKASKKIQSLISNAKAVIIVTHNMNFVERVCTSALWINNGVVEAFGEPKTVVAKYKKKSS